MFFETRPSQVRTPYRRRARHSCGRRVGHAVAESCALEEVLKSSCVFQAACCTALELSETPAQALLPNLAHCKVGAESSYNTLRRTRIPNSTRHLNTGEYWWLNSFFAPPKSCTLSYLSTFPLDGLLRCRNKTFRAFSRTLCVPHLFTNEFDE